jgi:hypothetical protein
VSETANEGRELLSSRINVLGLVLGVYGEKAERMNMSMLVMTIGPWCPWFGREVLGPGVCQSSGPTIWEERDSIIIEKHDGLYDPADRTLLLESRCGHRAKASGFALRVHCVVFSRLSDRRS